MDPQLAALLEEGSVELKCSKGSLKVCLHLLTVCNLGSRELSDTVMRARGHRRCYSNLQIELPPCTARMVRRRPNQHAQISMYPAATVMACRHRRCPLHHATAT
jgi:hypothetical protein